MSTARTKGGGLYNAGTLTVDSCAADSLRLRVALGFLQGPEFRTNLVALYDSALLHRTASAAEIDGHALPVPPLEPTQKVPGGVSPPISH